MSETNCDVCSLYERQIRDLEIDLADAIAGLATSEFAADQLWARESSEH